VTLPNGKSDHWTVTQVTDMGITNMKDGNQRELTVIVADSGTVTVMVDECVLTGKMAGASVTGTASASCPLGTGTWSATIHADK
jgi:hypothetical protein